MLLFNNRRLTSYASNLDLATLYLALLHCLQNLRVPRIAQRLLRALTHRIFSILLLSIGLLLMLIVYDFIVSFEQIILSDHLIEVFKLLMLV